MLKEGTYDTENPIGASFVRNICWVVWFLCSVGSPRKLLGTCQDVGIILGLTGIIFNAPSRAEKISYYYDIYIYLVVRAK